MAGICRNVVRAGVVVAIVGGVAMVVAGPDTVRAFMHQTRHNVRSAIDSTISDPVALRAQLRGLEAEYPKKIADVHGDLAELNEQIAQLEREMAVSQKVVAMTDSDLSHMQAILAKAEEAKSASEAQVVRVRFSDERPVNLDEAYAKANRVSQLKVAYSTRVQDLERDLGYLGQQRDRLTELLDQLETERAEFQTQLWSLDRQVDAIARNDRMIEVMQKRQETIDEHSRYHVASLDQLTSRLADIRAKQESKLQGFSQSSDIKNYENAAKYLLDGEQSKTGLVKPSKAKGIEIGPKIIEVGPKTTADDKGPIASR
ncbi:MAG: hypothetical protein ACKVW3_05020 [Phycisphaerales bacterium]